MSNAAAPPQFAPTAPRAPRGAMGLPWLLAGAVALPMMVAGAGAWMAWRATWTNAENQLAQTARAGAEYIRRVFDGHRLVTDRTNDLLAGLSDSEIEARGEALHHRLRGFLPGTGGTGVFVVDRAGRVIVNSAMHPSPPGTLAADRDFFLAMSAPGAPAVFVGRVYQSRATSEAYFAIAQRRVATGNGEPPGGFDGVVNVSVPPEDIAAGFSQLVARPDDTLGLARTDRQVLARYPSLEAERAPRDATGQVARLMSGDGGAGTLQVPSAFDGVPRLLVMRPVPGWPGLLVGAGRDRAAIIAEWREEALFNLAVATPATLALAVLAVVAWRGQRRLAEANALLDRRVADRTEALRASEARLRLATEGAGIGTWELDLRTGIGRRSPEAQGMLGSGNAIYTLDESATLIHPEDLPGVMATRARGLAGEGPYEMVFRTIVPAPDGGERWVLLRGRVERDIAGTPVHLAGIVMDITAQRRAELALSDSEARLRMATEAAGVGTWEFDMRTGRGRRSAQAMAMMGADAEDYPLEDTLSLCHPDDRAQVKAALAEARRTGHHLIVTRARHPAPDGGPRWVMSRGQWELAADGTPIRAAGVLVDITAERRAEEARREAEARFRVFQELSPLAFVIYRAVRDGSGTIVDFEIEYANPTAHRDHGLAPGALIGTRLLALSPAARTDENMFPRYRRILSGEAQGGEVQIEAPTPRGPRSFRNAAVRLDAERLAISMHDMTAEHAARDALARSHAELEALVEARTAALLRAADEARRAEESARQHEKLAALGQLVGGVAHDFNNLLQVVGSGAALLRRPSLAEGRRAMVLDGMERAAATARELTGRLLAFARQQPLVPETFSVNTRVLGMAPLLRQTLGSSVHVETVLAADLWPVHADPGQLELAVLNLAMNARDAMPKGGTLLLRTRNATLPDAPGRSAGDYVCLDIVDTGIGMSAAVLARALEPFFTTKEAGRGTGLGLPQAFGFARQSGGDLRVESTPGVGTTVTLKLPRAGEATGEAGDAAALATLRSPKGKAVLVVEDNEAAGTFAASLLEELGYRAELVPTADDALARIDAGEAVDAVFSDVVLPGMSGNELARALRHAHPGVAVLLATGYGGSAAEVSPPPGVETLPKPYQLVELAAALERALARTELDRQPA